MKITNREEKCDIRVYISAAQDISTYDINKEKKEEKLNRSKRVVVTWCFTPSQPVWLCGRLFCVYALLYTDCVRVFVGMREKE